MHRNQCAHYGRINPRDSFSGGSLRRIVRCEPAPLWSLGIDGPHAAIASSTSTAATIGIRLFLAVISSLSGLGSNPACLCPVVAADRK
jgi:hypothetical protein